MLSVIILAAGLGRRLGGRVSKPLVRINKKFLIDYSLEAFSRYAGVDEIILVGNALNQRALCARVKNGSFKKIARFVRGGKRRQDSVYNGLKEVSAKCAWVLIHDAARPFIHSNSIAQVIQAAKQSGAAILGLPVKATIKAASSGRWVKKTIERDSLWEIQTPQVFKKELITEAYRKFVKDDVTDDASLVEKLGGKVKIVKGQSNNIKITTRVDLLLAQLIAKRPLCNIKSV